PGCAWPPTGPARGYSRCGRGRAESFAQWRLGAGDNSAAGHPGGSVFPAEALPYILNRPHRVASDPERHLTLLRHAPLPGDAPGRHYRAKARRQRLPLAADDQRNLSRFFARTEVPVAPDRRNRARQPERHTEMVVRAGPAIIGTDHDEFLAVLRR